MAIGSVKAAVISLTAKDQYEQNIAQAMSLVRLAAKEGASWIQLPEMFPFMGDYKTLYDISQHEGGVLEQTLANLARELGIVLFAGSIPERPKTGDAGKVYNTAYVFGRDGSVLAKYRKVHLFNLSGDDKTPRYCESDGYLSGKNGVVFTVDGFKVALTICYDLRFPEFFASLSAEGDVDVIALPAAFTKTTGEAHWHVLLRARAIEWQAYVFAANQVGTHSPGKETYGHSLVIEPWGVVNADSGSAPGIAYAEITRQRLVEVRQKLPALSNRRHDLYKTKATW
jgi:nitrilase